MNEEIRKVLKDKFTEEINQLSIADIKALIDYSEKHIKKYNEALNLVVTDIDRERIETFLIDYTNVLNEAEAYLSEYCLMLGRKL
ncbi:hypothetical protein [Tenacibaculum maritimum]|uniref:hypothetical protein n=1 Tax=Tenacibaculum maritimum TaxID=107401 RepID=UPI0038775944